MRPTYVTVSSGGYSYRVLDACPWLTAEVVAVAFFAALALGAAALIVSKSRAKVAMAAGASVVGALLVKASRVRLEPGGSCASAETALSLFYDRYRVSENALAVGVLGFLLGGACLVIIARGRATSLQPPDGPTLWSSRLLTGASMAIAAAGLVLAVASRLERHALGNPAQPVPVLAKRGDWRGHAGFPQKLEARLSCRKAVSTGFLSLQTSYVAEPISDAEAARLGWSCPACSKEVFIDRAGESKHTIGGEAGEVHFEQVLTFQAVSELGHPLWPMRVGERRTLGRLHHERGKDGGWSVALAEGSLKHLARHEGDVALLSAEAMVLSVTKAEMRDGYRHFVVEVREGSSLRTLLVRAEEGETWLVHDDGSKERLIRMLPSDEERHGFLNCHFAEAASLPLSICSTGRDGSPLAGPVSSDGRRDSLMGLLTLGMIAPGEAPYDELCFQGASAGTGDAMPVAEFPPTLKGRALRSGFVLCPSSAPERSGADERR